MKGSRQGEAPAPGGVRIIERNRLLSKTCTGNLARSQCFSVLRALKRVRTAENSLLAVEVITGLKVN